RSTHRYFALILRDSISTRKGKRFALLHYWMSPKSRWFCSPITRCFLPILSRETFPHFHQSRSETASLARGSRRYCHSATACRPALYFYMRPGVPKVVPAPSARLLRVSAASSRPGLFSPKESSFTESRSPEFRCWAQ